jgi:DNA-directed RNA polymerase, beta subunit/140 kD subunit
MAVKPVSRNSFGIKQNTFPVPNINQLQIDSFNKFWEEDLKDILAEFSPMKIV